MGFPDSSCPSVLPKPARSYLDGMVFFMVLLKLSGSHDSAFSVMLYNYIQLVAMLLINVNVPSMM